MKVKLYNLIFSDPTFNVISDVCDADKLDGGITKGELQVSECLDLVTNMVALIGLGVEEIDSTFDMFDEDANGVVSEQEFLNKALTMI